MDVQEAKEIFYYKCRSEIKKEIRDKVDEIANKYGENEISEPFLELVEYLYTL